MARASGRDGIQFGAPSRGKGIAKRSVGGRQCDAPGCTTVLSTYNASSTCWLHTGPELRHPLARS